MATTITGKLNKPATQFQAGESTGFGIRLGEQYYDRETKQKEWTNYQAVLFAKNPQQIAFYQQALVEGSIVSITGQQQQIKTFEGQNGLLISIQLLDAKLGYVGTTGQAQQQAPAQPQPQRQQAPRQAPQQAPAGPRHQSSAPTPPASQQSPEFDDFDDDIPF